MFIITIVTDMDNITFITSVYITLFIVFAVLCAAIKPYKHTAANSSGVALLATTALLFFSFQLFYLTKVALIMLFMIVGLPHCVLHAATLCTNCGSW